MGPIMGPIMGPMLLRHAPGADRVGAASLVGVLTALVGCFAEQSSISATADGVVTTTGTDGSSSGGATVDPGTGSGPGPEAGETDLSPDGSSGSSSSGDPGTTEATDVDSSSGTLGEGSTTGNAPVGVDALEPGDLVITEVMWNPHCGLDACEWFELLNATESDVNLLDLYVQDDDHNARMQGRVTADVIIGPGELVVLTRGQGDWPYEFEAAASYGPNPGLNNNRPDRVSVLNAGGILDETASFPFSEDEGVAWLLSGNVLDAVSNDSALNWCLATAVLPTNTVTEFGTPLELNEPCG
jgi:Lamin Tail Domain